MEQDDAIPPRHGFVAGSTTSTPMTDHPKPSASQSLLMTISRRFDAASALFARFMIPATLLVVLIVILAIIVPDSSRHSEMEKRLADKQKDVAALRDQVRGLADEIKALDDPYNIERYARERYKFKRGSRPPAKVLAPTLPRKDQPVKADPPKANTAKADGPAAKGNSPRTPASKASGATPSKLRSNTRGT